MEVQPTYFPSVPRIFEKIYTLATSARARTASSSRPRSRWASRCASCSERGERGAGRARRRRSTPPTRRSSRTCATCSAGEIRQCVTGAAPIAKRDPRVLLRLRRAGDGGLRDDRDLHRRPASTRPTASASARSASRSPGVEAKIADDGELLLRGAEHLPGLLQERGGHGRDAGRRLAAHRRPRPIDEDGFLFITGRKKDIIITAGGKNITPANLENGLKQNRWISQAVVVGDRRPYLVALITLDPEEVAGVRRSSTA